MYDLDQLREKVYEANLQLVEHGLVTFTFGNVSQIDRTQDMVAIKPSGVSYQTMKPEDIVIVDLRGRILEGKLNPSSDTATHLELYRSFKGIGGVAHTHSRHATMWAQAQREIPCFGTTHADYFYGPVPVTEPMSEEEIKSGYELNTGKVIVRRFGGMDPMQTPAVLVSSHGPFTWGRNAMDAMHNAVVLEECAQTALGTLSLSSGQGPIPQALLDKHFLRKHGEGAYYGQKGDQDDFDDLLQE